MCHPVIFDLNFGQLSLFVKPQISDYIRAKTSPPSLALLSYFMRSWPRVAFRATAARISRAVLPALDRHIQNREIGVFLFVVISPDVKDRNSLRAEHLFKS